MDLESTAAKCEQMCATHRRASPRRPARTPRPLATAAARALHSPYLRPTCYFRCRTTSHVPPLARHTQHATNSEGRKIIPIRLRAPSPCCAARQAATARVLLDHERRMPTADARTSNATSRGALADTVGPNLALPHLSTSGRPGAWGGTGASWSKKIKRRFIT